MRKTIALVTAGMLVLSLGPGSAAAQKKKKKKKPSVEQKVEGTVALPAPFQNDSGCFAGLHRRIAILGQENVNGDVGYHFDVDKATWGTNFVLEPTGGLGSVDLDTTSTRNSAPRSKSSPTRGAPARRAARSSTPALRAARPTWSPPSSTR